MLKLQELLKKKRPTMAANIPKDTEGPLTNHELCCKNDK
jgi:hypothetical protein